MEPVKIQDNVTLSFGSLELTGDVYRTAYVVSGAQALFLATGRANEPISINLDAHDLTPNANCIFVKDYAGHEGLADSMVKAGMGTITRTVTFGEFDTKAHEFELAI